MRRRMSNDSQAYDPAKDPEGQPSELEKAFQSFVSPESVQTEPNNGQSANQTDGQSDRQLVVQTEGQTDRQTEESGGNGVADSHACARTNESDLIESQAQRWKRTLRPWQFKYVMALRTLGAVGLACHHTGLNRTLIGNWRGKDPEFAAACVEAEADKIEAVETALLISATVGDPEPIYQTGKRVGTRRRKSDKAAEIILRAERPEKYRPDYQGAPQTQSIILASVEQVADVVRNLSPVLKPALLVERTDGDMEQTPKSET